ncbi:MAG TPA: glycosyltransferase family 39 protein [Blastocatellia bacterium]|nr:glycosyltransferase family 39 protein [Blastocatellia bacterium]
MRGLKSNLDFALVTVLIGGFAAVAAQRLGTVPVPEGDEAFTLQVPYEMLVRGKLALPMLRYLGGNIENVWHSFTPVCFLLLGGFLKLFGLGLVQGRAFNLITAATTLLMVYLIGRKLFDWRAGLVAVVMLIGDQTFLERSRLLRNDYAAATFALLAFFLYEMSERRRSSRLLAASGLAAGAGVMCHTNILYMVAAIGLLIVLREGWRAFRSKKLYVFAGSAFVVMAYEIIYDVIDYKNFLLQNRGDDLHFRVLGYAGFWQNVLEEKTRYAKWYTGGLMFPGLSQVTLRVFQALTVLAIIYLIVECAKRLKRGGVLSEPRVRVFIVTLVVILFHAVIVSHKRIYYFAHLAPWFALCVGILARDGLDWIASLRRKTVPRARLAHRLAIALVAVAVTGFGLQLARQYRDYSIDVRNPDLASFEEFTSVIRSLVPDGLCPVAVKNPGVWLAFPEADRCFATIEGRMKEDLDIDGKDYALVTRPNFSLDRDAKREGEDSLRDYHLIGEMRETPYGSLLIYYTGKDPRYLALEPTRYQFFGDWRGHALIQ